MSTFNKIGFENLFIKGVLFNKEDFRGTKGKDQTSATKGVTGAKGADDGFEFNVIYTTPTSIEIELPDATLSSSDGIIVKTNGVLTAATQRVSDSSPTYIRVKTVSDETMAILYNNSMPQTIRFTKVLIPQLEFNGEFQGYYRWDI